MDHAVAVERVIAAERLVNLVLGVAQVDAVEVASGSRPPRRARSRPTRWSAGARRRCGRDGRRRRAAGTAGARERSPSSFGQSTVPTLAVQVSRYAPSTTGRAHAGTLLAALLAWLDARKRGARFLLRLEDLDPERSRPAWSLHLREDLAWLGLDFDAVEEQHGFAARHEAALDRLAALGVLYPCACSRSLLRAESDPALGRGGRYPNRCRGRSLPAGGWRASGEPLRARSRAAASLPRTKAASTSRRIPSPRWATRSCAGATAPSPTSSRWWWTTQRAASRAWCAATTSRRARRRRSRSSACSGCPPGLPPSPAAAREGGGKLAKRHGALGADALRGVYGAPALVGFLAFACGLRPDPAPATPAELLRDFDWSRVSRENRVVRWDGAALALGR